MVSTSKFMQNCVVESHPIQQFWQFCQLDEIWTEKHTWPSRNLAIVSCIWQVRISWLLLCPIKLAQLMKPSDGSTANTCMHATKHINNRNIENNPLLRNNCNKKMLPPLEELKQQQLAPRRWLHESPLCADTWEVF